MPRGPDGKRRHMANTFQGEFPYKNTAEDGFAGVAPVKSFPPNGYGLYDMAGNVWNWCSDLYRADAHAHEAERGLCENPAGPSRTWDPSDPHNPVKRIIKGGSFLCHVSYCESYRPSARRGTPPDTGSSHVGFRCVMTASGAAPDGKASLSCCQLWNRRAMLPWADVPLGLFPPTVFDLLEIVGVDLRGDR